MWMISSFPTKTIRQLRSKVEHESASTIKDQYTFPLHLAAPFDGKRRKQREQMLDFLAVCVTGYGMDKEKLLGEIPISDGIGEQIVQNVLRLLQEWNIEKNIVGLSFDTTSAITGSETGAGDVFGKATILVCMPVPHP